MSATYDLCQDCGVLELLNHAHRCVVCADPLGPRSEPTDHDIYNGPGREGGIAYEIDEGVFL